MEFRLLEYFLAAAREQDITAAAESLHFSQPALSMQLKALEAEFSRQLLIRGTKGSCKAILTEEGKGCASGRKKWFPSCAAQKKSAVPVKPLQATSIPAQLKQTSSACLPRLQRSCEKRRCHISSGNAEHVLEYLDKVLIDFGLLFSQIGVQKYEAIPVPAKGRVLMRRDLLPGKNIRYFPKRQASFCSTFANWAMGTKNKRGCCHAPLHARAADSPFCKTRTKGRPFRISGSKQF